MNARPAVPLLLTAALAAGCTSSGGGRPEPRVPPEDARQAVAALREAETAMRDNQLELAEAACSRAADLNPTLAEAYYLRGNIHLRRMRRDGDFREGEAAVRDYTAALQLVPRSGKALFNRAVAYNQLALGQTLLNDREPDARDAGRYGGRPALFVDAARDLMSLLEINARDVDAHYFLARLLDERFQAREVDAARHYQKYLELGGRSPKAQERLVALAPFLLKAPPENPQAPGAPRDGVPR